MPTSTLARSDHGRHRWTPNTPAACTVPIIIDRYRAARTDREWGDPPRRSIRRAPGHRVGRDTRKGCRRMTTRAAALVAVMLLPLLLGACQQDWPTTEAPAETVPVPEPSAYSIEEQAYLATLDDENISYGSDAAAIEAGHAICDYLEAGAGTILDAGQIGVNAGYSHYEAGYIVGAAAAMFCPDQLERGDW